MSVGRIEIKMFMGTVGRTKKNRIPRILSCFSEKEKFLHSTFLICYDYFTGLSHKLRFDGLKVLVQEQEVTWGVIYL